MKLSAKTCWPGKPTNPCLPDTDKLPLRRSARSLGKIDVLFVNGGIAKFALPEAVYRGSLRRNFLSIDAKGAYFTVQKGPPYLNDNASIILNTSVAGTEGLLRTRASTGQPRQLPFPLARTFAGALAARNIRVNAVAPGPIETPIFGRTGLSKEAIDDFAKNIVSSGSHAAFGEAVRGGGSRRVPSFPCRTLRTSPAWEINVDGGMGADLSL